MAVGDILRVRFMCRYPPQLGQNIRHYRIDAETGTGVTHLEIANALHNAMQGLYSGVMTAQAEFFRVGVQRIFPGAMLVEVESTLPPLAGADIGDALPSQCAGVIKLMTGMAGRANRGRAYAPFPAEVSSNPNGRCTPAHVILLQALGDALVSPAPITGAGGTATLTPVMFRRATGASTPLILALARTIFGTQRRRGDFGAGNLGDIT